VVRTAPDMAHRPAVQPPAAARHGIRGGSRDRLSQPLTGLGAWASVVILAGIMR